jgi:hypothetical protein
VCFALTFKKIKSRENQAFSLQEDHFTRGQFHQHLCAKQKVPDAQGSAKKLPFNFTNILRQLNLPNMNGEICQINSQFAKRHSTKKSLENMLMHLTPTDWKRGQM